MWNHSIPHAHPAQLPDSFDDDDDCALNIVYDAPEADAGGELEEDAVPERDAVPSGNYAQSAAKPRRGRAPVLASPAASAAQAAPGSPYGGSPDRQGSAALGMQQSMLAHEVQTLLHRTIQAATQHSPLGLQPTHPQQRQQGRQEEGDGEEEVAAGTGRASAWQLPQVQSGFLPQGTASQQRWPQRQVAAGEEGRAGRRPRQPPLHHSPAVPAPTAAAPGIAAGHVAGGEEGPRSGGRRWRPTQKPVTLQAPPGWPSQHGQRPQQATPTAQLAAQVQTAAPQQQQQQLLQGIVQTSQPGLADGAAPSAAPAAPAAGGGGGAGVFFAVDEDLLIAHMHLQAPGPATAATPGGWRQAGQRGKQRAQRLQQSQQASRAAAEEPGPRGGAGAGGGATASGLAGLLGRQEWGGAGACGTQQAPPAGVARNQLAALLDVGAGARGRGAAKKKHNPIYGAGGTGDSRRSPERQPLTSPREHARARFLIKEPSTAPRLSGSALSQAPALSAATAAAAAQALAQQAQQAQHSRPGVQMLTGRAPGSHVRRPLVQAEIIDDGADDWLGGEAQHSQPAQHGRGFQDKPPQQQQQQPGEHPQRHGGAAVPGGMQSTPARGFPEAQLSAQRGHQAGSHLEAGAAHPPLPAGAPPTSYKTPAHQLRALFHSRTPASRRTGGGIGGSGEGPAAGDTGFPLANGAWQGAAASAGGAQGGSCEKGMSLQRQFVAALAPVSRSAAAPRQRGGGAGTGLYGRLQVVAAAERAVQQVQGRRGSGARARLTVVDRENEANMTKCVCRVEVESATAAAGEREAASELAGAGVVVALFQSRAAREVDLVPESVVVVRAPWRMLRVAGSAAPVMLCSAVEQG